MNKYKIIWWSVWGLCVMLCLSHYGYSLFTNIDTQIINIEHEFYLLILAMAAISILPIKSGKILLWFILFFHLSTINKLPEVQKITALEHCAEGKCLQTTNEEPATTNPPLPVNEKTGKNKNESCNHT